MDNLPPNAQLQNLEMRVHGDAGLPTLVYLPGLHGNWKLIGGFRKALDGRLRFVETTYPPTLTWTLDDYAASVEEALAEKGIFSAWLLAESFGSQVVWPIIARSRFQVEGLILAGGFVRHPYGRGVRLAERFCGKVSFTVLLHLLFGYARLARFRFRRSPETIQAIREFVESLTELDRQAAKHRLHLVAQSNPRSIAQKTNIPVYGLTGLFDPVVPWHGVRRWLKRNCPGLRAFQIIWHADHNVLGTAPNASADHVVRWMKAKASVPLSS
jgi:pimeloyl-ACP methyl ester carboxylesterase